MLPPRHTPISNFLYRNRSARQISHHPLRFLLIALFGLFVVLSVPVLSHPTRLPENIPEVMLESPPESTQELIAEQPIAQSLDATEDTIGNASNLVQQGIALYEAEQFSGAVEVWQQALTILTAQEDSLNQAFVLSNLSLAYQQLGRWHDAENAIAASLAHLQANSTDSPTYLSIRAKALNAQGRLYWFQGNAEDALASWQQATLAYDAAGDETGVMLSLLNQTRALQGLGFSLQAETQLQRVMDILEQQFDPDLRAIGQQQLGQVLRQIGELTRSQAVLQASLEDIEAANLSPDIKSTTLLELGNTEQALANRAIAIGNTDNADEHVSQAIAFYQQAILNADSPPLQLQAELNQLSLLIARQQWEDAVDRSTTIQPAIANLPPNRTTLYAQLNFANSLMQIRNAIGSSRVASRPSSQQIAQILATTLQQARTLDDAIVESYALGQLGNLYEQSGQWQDAQDLTQQAWLKAEAVQTASVRYRWEWQLGRLREKQGDKQGAIAAYTAAVESLQSIRNDLLRTSADIQFSFRDDVEPVYRGLVELLLTTEGNAQPSQENLKRAIQQIDSLQLAELENYLRCDLAQIVTVSEIEADPTAAKLYPMLLTNRLAVVLELPNQPLQYHDMIQSRSDVETFLQQLRRDLSEPDRTPEAITGLQQVYQWLIQPFEPILQNDPQIQTLVFVLDGELRNISMASLYDGENYLISQYAVALAPRLELFQPSPRSSTLKVFLGGVGEPQTVFDRTFSEIANLTPELDSIKQLVNANQPLLNEAFTQANLEQQLSSETFSVIHLKTHGVFSSDPEETFIVAYQDLITSQEFGRLIRTSRLGEASPIELLVLSACSTAQGDDRAVLGLAGIAIQSGARSAISTLWEAQDVPNTQLMIQFYQELSNPNITKAQALRLAQLHLIEQGYTTPHIWATYVLVGNWL